MGIISGVATLMLPFISATIAFCSAFIITIWFALTIIYAIIEIINLLLGQPLVGWLMTGNIASTNDIRNLFNNQMFSFTSPIIIFLYIGLAISLLMVVIYFIAQIFMNNKVDSFNFSSSFFSIGLIILSVVWIPFLYSLLVLTTATLMIGLTSLLNLAKVNNSISNAFDVAVSREKLVTNLLSLKLLKEQGQFNFVDINDSVIQEWMNSHLSSNERVAFKTLIENWNVFLADNNLSIEQLDKWINDLNTLDLNDLSKLTISQKETLIALGNFSQGLYLMNSTYDTIFNKILSINELKIFNSWFITSNSIDLETFRLNNNIFDLNNLDENLTIEQFAFYTVNNQIIYSNKFNQNLVNILYSLALGKNVVFVPGWSTNVVEQSWNLFWIIPMEMKMIGLNISAYLFYNIKAIAIGTIINSVLVTAIIAFALVLIKRFVYITFWPFQMFFILARSTGQGNFEQVKEGFNELFYKFISILVFGFLWNFLCLLVTSIFMGLDSINPSELFGNETWIMDIFKLFIIIGIFIIGFPLIQEVIQKLSEEKSGASQGASEIIRAKREAENENRKIKDRGMQSARKASKSINRSMSEKWNNTGRQVFQDTKGQGFRARTGATARAMYNYRGRGRS